MAKPPRRVVCAAIIATALAGCTAMTGRTAGRNIDDAAITTAVKAKLVGERASTLTSVDVDTINGTVYLTGTVPTAADRQRAAALARGVDGVIAVENNLESRIPAGDNPPDVDRNRSDND